MRDPGRSEVSHKAEGITRIINNNNHKIATDNQNRRVFRQRAYTKSIEYGKPSVVVQNKGSYVPKNDFSKYMPEGTILKMYQEMIQEFHQAVINYWKLSTHLIVPFGVKSLPTHTMFDRDDGGVVSTTEGWAATTPKMSSCGDHRVLDTVRQGLEDMKAKKEVKQESWHCNDVLEAMDYLRPAEFANLVFRPQTGTS
jgi:hypothetical protein